MKCNICNEEYERLAKHVIKTHNMKYSSYLLTFVYSVDPMCGCGCNMKTLYNVNKEDFNKYIHGHHMSGTKRTNETKERIGKANSINMKNYMKLHPELIKIKIDQLNNGKTQESERQRIQATKDFYSNVTQEKLEEMSLIMKNYWKNNRAKMLSGILKAGCVYREMIKDGKVDLIERNKKISNTITQKYLDGGFEWSRGNYTSIKMNKTYYYRSSWELEYMKILDNDNEVIKWTYEPFAIEYTFDNVKRKYIPDFLVTRTNDINEFVEIKPKSLIKTEMNKAKSIAAKVWCKENGFTYVVWSFDDTTTVIDVNSV